MNIQEVNESLSEAVENISEAKREFNKRWMENSIQTLEHEMKEIRASWKRYMKKRSKKEDDLCNLETGFNIIAGEARRNAALIKATMG